MIGSITGVQPKQENQIPMCSVCLENIVPPTKPTDAKIRALACGHPFHEPCIEPWKKSHNNCPICRQVIDLTRIVKERGVVDPNQRQAPHPIVQILKWELGLVIICASVWRIMFLANKGNYEVATPSSFFLPFAGIVAGSVVSKLYFPLSGLFR